MSSTRREFAMPDVGEGLTEAEVVTWHVAVGDTVTVNQIICEIETAKAVVELPSPYAGTVGALLVPTGQTVAVGAPILVVETGPAGSGGSAPATANTAPAPTPAPAVADGDAPGAKIGEAGADGRIATLVGYGPRPGSVTRRPRRRPDGGVPPSTTPVPASDLGAEPAPPVSPGPAANGATANGSTAGRAANNVATAPSAVTGAAPAPVGGAAVGGPVPLAKPPVRKLARDLGIDLRSVTPSGPGGVITRADVEASAATATAATGSVASAAAASGGVRREPIRGVRKATAAAMVASAFTAPHVTEFLTVDVTAMMALRDRLRASRAYEGVKLSPLAFAAKAVCLAARRTPSVNAHWDEAAGEIVYYDRVQLGIAAATPRGLMVPKIRDADALSLRELAVALGELATTARSGKTPPADLVGGTITITNVGVFGVDTGTPILNPGEAAILALGSVKQAPWVVDGELAVRTVCQLALSFDHRLVDGEQGSRFLADVGALLTDPGLALTW